MADMNQLIKLLNELEDQLVNCMKCGMCQAVCPVFSKTGREGHVARGKIALLEGLAKEMIKDPEGVEDKLTTCLLCGACTANCPSGVGASDIFLKARAILTGYKGLSPVKKAIFRGMLTKPKLFNTLVSMGSKFQGVFTSPANDVIGSSCSRLLSPVLGDRHFMPLADKPFHKIAPKADSPRGKSGLKVAFYYGCLVDKIYPRIGEAVLKVLDHHGVGVFMPEAQACCGIPALASGDTQSYEKLVRLNLKAFAAGEFDYLITPCATCTSTIKKLWPTMGEFDAATRHELEKLAEKTMDVNAFVTDVLGVEAPEAQSANGARKVTYHDPCHLKKSLGVAEQPRKLLQANTGYQLVEMNEADTCCGCGGSFNLQHYDLSTEIGRDKRDNIAASGAQTVATGCPACMLQISDMLSQKGDRIEVRHAIELYAETL